MSMMQTVIPKSDQLNFDDFISGQSKTIKITKVKVNPSAEQKCTINYEGDEGKPYKPNKSMCRVLFKVWGEDENTYAGKFLTLYGDQKVRFGALEVGGILISHMSGIDKDVTVMLTSTRANKKPFTVKPITVAKLPSEADWLSDIACVPTLDGLQSKFKDAYKQFEKIPEAVKRLTEAKDKRKTELSTQGAE